LRSGISLEYFNNTIYSHTIPFHCKGLREVVSIRFSTTSNTGQYWLFSNKILQININDPSKKLSYKLQKIQPDCNIIANNLASRPACCI